MCRRLTPHGRQAPVDSEIRCACAGRQEAPVCYAGAELQDAINCDPKALATFETICGYGALRKGLIKDVDEAAKRQYTPEVAFVAKPVAYTVSSDKKVAAADVACWCARSPWASCTTPQMGTAAVAIGTAAAIPGTLVNLAAGGGARNTVRFGHLSDLLRIGAEAKPVDGEGGQEGHHEPQRIGRLSVRAGDAF